MQEILSTCKDIRLHCLSEQGWKDTQLLENELSQSTSQWTSKYSDSNSIGPSALVCIDGKTKFLMDCGWNEKVISAMYKKYNVDDIIAKEVDMLVVSHEHMDHMYGIPSVLKLNQKIKILLPHSISDNAIKYINGASFPGIENNYPHLGKLVINKPMIPLQIANGCYSISFPVENSRDAASEQIIACNVEGKGVALIIGCCHQRLSKSVPFIKDYFKKDIYAIYGGLHLSPFGQLEKDFEEELKFIKAIPNLYCNHCTGDVAIKELKMHGIIIKSIREGANRIIENDKITL